MVMAKAFHQRSQTSDGKFFAIERAVARNVQLVIVPVRSRSEHKGTAAVIRRETHLGEHKVGRELLLVNPIAAVPSRVECMNCQTVPVNQAHIEGNVATDSHAIDGASRAQNIGPNPPTPVIRPEADTRAPQPNWNRNVLAEECAHFTANQAQRVLTVANDAEVDHWPRV